MSIDMGADGKESVIAKFEFVFLDRRDGLSDISNNY